VYRISDGGAKKLNPIDAINPQIFQSGRYEFAIRHEESSALDKFKARVEATRAKPPEHNHNNDREAR
jgi:hypothetical protein